MEKTADEGSKPKLPAVINVRLVHKKLGKKKLIIGGVLLAILVVLLAIGGWYKHTMSSATYVDGSKFQAIFLEGGQVYFGKLSVLHTGYRLTNVYYLETPTTPDSSAQSPNTKPNAKQSPNLVKLGSELHGPEDQIVFEKDNVLFWENLKSDSKVSKAIDAYLKK